MGFTVYRKLNSMYIPQSYNSLQETTHGDHGLLWNYFGIFLSLVKKKRFEIWQPIFYFFFQNRERSRVFLFLYSCKKKNTPAQAVADVGNPFLSAMWNATNNPKTDVAYIHFITPCVTSVSYHYSKTAETLTLTLFQHNKNTFFFAVWIVWSNQTSHYK